MGGLSVLRAVREALPYEDLVYLADSANAPYGDKPVAHIQARSEAALQQALSLGARALLLACNTASVHAAKGLRATSPIPVVAMEPAIKPAVALTRSGVVAVLATTQTLQSEAVARLCALHGAKVTILLQACPGLVECVEANALHAAPTRALLHQYVAPLLAQGVDTLVLGCTHYAFLAPLLRELVGPDVTIIDPAPAVAQELARRVAALGLGEGGAAGGALQAAPPSLRFFSSLAAGAADAALSSLWGAPVQAQVWV